MVLMVGMHMAQVFLGGLVQVPARDELDHGRPAPRASRSAWGSPGSSCAGTRTRPGRSSSAPSRRGALPVVGDAHRALHPRRRHRRRRDAQPLLRDPRLPHPGVHLRRSSACTCCLVLRHGISEPPDPGELGRPEDVPRAATRSTSKKDGVPFWPDAAWRDVVFGVAMALGILALAVFVGPPKLGAPPDPSIIDADPRPDWYLLWYFAVLALAPSSLETYIIILGAARRRRAASSPPPFLSNKGERSARRRPWAIGDRGDDRRDDRLALDPRRALALVAELRRAAADRRRRRRDRRARSPTGRGSSTTRGA